MSEALAAIRTGQDLYQACISSDEDGQALCLTWIAGFLGGVRGASELSGTHILCLPAGEETERARHFPARTSMSADLRGSA